MKVTIRLSGSVRAIYPSLNEEIVLEISEPMSIKRLLLQIGINPLVAPLILLFDKKVKNTDYIIKEEENVITVMGPLAGG